MDIISLKFAFLAIVSILVYYILNYKYRIGYLTILSCAFIATYSYFLLIYIVLYSLVNYLLGLKISNSRSKKLLFRIGIVINLSQLAILKYASFAIDPLIHLFNGNFQISGFAEIIVPVGISFFTLQGIGYLFNVKMGWEKPERKFLNFLLYITFYPKFLSGPIERSNHFLSQLIKFEPFNSQNVTDGLRIALIGFVKKIVIANQLASLVNSSYKNPDNYDGSTLWMVLLIQPLYLYFDFSGYTNIAIGFSKALGIQLLPNFNRPFLSENISTFWKRFHISLSSWFNDYVFKQVSFKRRKWGIYASAYAVLVTWLFFGIWHGAGWSFFLLGLLQALAINFEFFTRKWRSDLFSNLPDNARMWVGRFITYLFYCGSLVFFFSPNIQTANHFFSKLSRMKGFSLGGIRIEVLITVLIFIIIFMTLEVLENDFKKTYDELERWWRGDQLKYKFFRWCMYFTIITVLIVLSNEVQQFVYFQF
jgi:alginate O-acetyltransferase complex protein AlgI